MHIVAIISAYAPYVGLSMVEKDEFWEILVHVFLGTSERELWFWVETQVDMLES